MSYNDKALKLVSEAERKLSPPKGIFGFLLMTFIGKTTKVEEAIECYQKAGYLFKMVPNWYQAGSAFQEAAKLHFSLKSHVDAATKYTEAANCFKKCDRLAAVECYKCAIEIYTEIGKFSIAAKLHENIADMLVMETPDDVDSIIYHYQKASDFFRGEEITLAANKCLLKVARYEALRGNFASAILIFEQIAAGLVNHSLMKYSIKEYFFNAGLCHLSVDVMNAREAIERYIDMYPPFQDTHEYKLLRSIIISNEEMDLEGFTTAVTAYDSLCHLDAWQNTILLGIKKEISGQLDLR